VKATSKKLPCPSQLLNGIDNLALLSFYLILLIIFMTAPSRAHDGWALDLARTDHAAAMPSARREDAILISVYRDGNIFFGTHQIRSDDLPASIRESVRHGSERKVYLKVDARAKYADAALVIDQVAVVGIQNVGIITEQLPPTPKSRSVQANNPR
jgi:biopolymer transport protein ExbD